MSSAISCWVTEVVGRQLWWGLCRRSLRDMRETRGIRQSDGLRRTRSKLKRAIQRAERSSDSRVWWTWWTITSFRNWWSIEAPMICTEMCSYNKNNLSPLSLAESSTDTATFKLDQSFSTNTKNTQLPRKAKNGLAKAVSPILSASPRRARISFATGSHHCKALAPWRGKRVSQSKGTNRGAVHSSITIVQDRWGGNNSRSKMTAQSQFWCQWQTLNKFTR